MFNRIPCRAVVILWLAILSIILSNSSPTLMQGKKSNPGTTPAPLATKTRLEVQQFSKEFAEWVKTITITSADKLTFRWSTDEAAANGGIWKVSDTPVSFSIATQTTVAAAALQKEPHIIASGNAGSSAISKFLTFEIDFALLVPKNPPPSPRTFWVFLTPTREAARGGIEGVGVPSVPVKIVYRKSSSETTQFPECFGNTQCSIGYYCTQSNECKVVGYVCDGHVVKGSDKSVYECSPYICQAAQCLKTCASVDDCTSPFVCNQAHQCIMPGD